MRLFDFGAPPLPAAPEVLAVPCYAREATLSPHPFTDMLKAKNAKKKIENRLAFRRRVA
jgi:hypothetical protein